MSSNRPINYCRRCEAEAYKPVLTLRDTLLLRLIFSQFRLPKAQAA